MIYYLTARTGMMDYMFYTTLVELAIYANSYLKMVLG